MHSQTSDSPTVSSQDSNSRIICVLQLIAGIAQDLSRHWFQSAECLVTDHSDLVTLITSAFNDLQKCTKVINARAPISSLPVDVLGLILQDAHQNEVRNSRPSLSRRPLENHPSEPSQTPLSLSRVSRSWYHVINNSPRLWTTIDVFPPWNLSLINMFFARSKSYPIYLNIMAKASVQDRRNKENNNFHSDIDRLCSILVPHIPRCRSISVCIDHHYLPLSVALQGHFRDIRAPLLQQFFLQGPNYFPEVNLQPIFTLGAPMLSYVHLDPYGAQDWGLPFASLTSLHLETHTTKVAFSQLAAMISQCPLLETLSVYDNIIFDRHNPQVTLSHLRLLQLYGNTRGLGDILRSISAPVLESLVVAPFPYVNPHVVRLENKFNALQSITLAPPSFCLESSLQLVSGCFPNVVDVTLIGKKPDALVEALAKVNANGDIYFPNMRSLALRNISPRLLETVHALETLIPVRLLSDRPLQTLYLDRESVRQVSGLQWLHDQVDVIELDKWSILRKDSLFCDEDDDKFYPP